MGDSSDTFENWIVWTKALARFGRCQQVHRMRICGVF